MRTVRAPRAHIAELRCNVLGAPRLALGAAELDLAKLLTRPRQTTPRSAPPRARPAKPLPDPAKLLPTLHRRSLQQGDGANSCNHAYDGFCTGLTTRMPTRRRARRAPTPPLRRQLGGLRPPVHGENNYCEYREPGSSTEWTFSSTNESVVDACGTDICVKYVKYTLAAEVGEATVELTEYYVAMCASDPCKEALESDTNNFLCDVSNHCGKDMLKGYFDAAVSNTSSAAFMTDHMSTICGNADCKEMYSNGTDQLDAFCDIYDHCGEDMVTDALDMIAESNGSTTSSAAQAGFVADHASTICGNADCKEVWSNNNDDEGQENLNAFCDIHDHCGESSGDMLADMYMINMTAGFNDSDPTNETIRAFYIDNAIAVCGSADCKQAHHDGGLPAGAVESWRRSAPPARSSPSSPPPCRSSASAASASDRPPARRRRPPARQLADAASAARPPARARAGRPPPAPLPQGLCCCKKKKDRPTPPTARASRSRPAPEGHDVHVPESSAASLLQRLHKASRRSRMKSPYYFRGFTTVTIATHAPTTHAAAAAACAALGCTRGRRADPSREGGGHTALVDVKGRARRG